MDRYEQLREKAPALKGRDGYVHLSDFVNGIEQLKDERYDKEAALNDLETVFDYINAHQAIEKELGTDLITPFVVMKKGVYCRQEDFICWYQGRDNIRIHIKGFYNSKLCDDYYWKDYGKTWAFTREELE